MDIQDIHLLKSFYDLEPQLEKFGEAVDKGLKSENKSLPSKFFYDGRGSLLFDKICKLQEYYLTRTEVALLNKIIPEFSSLTGNNLHLIEFGSGSSEKVKILLSIIWFENFYFDFIDFGDEMDFLASRTKKKKKLAGKRSGCVTDVVGVVLWPWAILAGI